MRVTVDLIIAAIALYFICNAIMSYAQATGSVWQRLLAVGKNSATILWNRFAVVVAGLSDVMVYVADWLNAPGVADAIKTVMNPAYVAPFVIVVALVSEWARRRTLPSVSLPTVS